MLKTVIREYASRDRIAAPSTGAFLFLVPALLVLFSSVPRNATAQEASLDITEILRFINEERSKGCYCGDTFFEPAEPLMWDDELEEAALLHVKDMITNDFFSHENPEGERAARRILNITDRFKNMSENIARGQDSDVAVMTGWMDSPRHCANIMRPGATHVGVAVRTGSEVENSHGITRAYWTMKLGTAIHEIDKTTPDAVASIPDNDDDFTYLELDRDAVLEILNRVREEGAYCSEDADRKHTTGPVLGWHDDIEQAARDRAKILAKNNEEVKRGDDRKLKRTWIRKDGLSMGHYIYEKASFDFEDALSNWLSDPYSCRRIMAGSITFASVAAAVNRNSGAEGAAEDAPVYWVFMFVIATPESMKDEIASALKDLDITVYGRKNCGRTRSLHRELDGFDIEHEYASYESNQGSEPNRDEMMRAFQRAERRIGNGRTLPYVMVGNTMFTGFGSAASLYRAVEALD